MQRNCRGPIPTVWANWTRACGSRRARPWRRLWSYTKAIGDGEGPFELDKDYQAEAREIAHVQAAVAAARLAGLLNAALTN